MNKIKLTVATLFALASLATGCDLLDSTGSNPDFELCLQNGFMPCPDAPPSDLSD
jgi:hypothetical protein